MSWKKTLLTVFSFQLIIIGYIFCFSLKPSLLQMFALAHVFANLPTCTVCILTLNVPTRIFLKWIERSKSQ